MKNKLCLIAGMLMISLFVTAQEPQKRFSPEKFDAELRQYIIQEAGLTQKEADAFFPVYKEMREKQRVLFNNQKKHSKVKPTTEEGCLKAVQERDSQELEQKRIQQSYHNRFLEMLPASKVYDILKAEDRFHRNKLRQWSDNKGKPQRRHD